MKHLLTLTALAVFTLCGPALAENKIVNSTDGSTGRKAFSKVTPAVSGATVVPNVAPEPLGIVAADLHAPAANTAAVVTYAANATKKHVIYGITVSYGGSGTLSGGNIKIEDVSGTTIFTQDISAKDTYTWIFPRPLRGAAINTALIVTLAAGGANVDGKVCVLGHDLETP